MSTQAAGKVNVVLSVNQVNFTAAMKEAQANLDKFAGKAKSAGHEAVSSFQMTSASLRALHGGFQNNLRSMERWVSQSKLASQAAATMFPLVGASTFGYMIVELGMKVAAFIKQADEMPKTIQKGFESLTLSQKTSNDELDVTNDKLQNSIDKLEKKPTNNLKTAMDEAKTSADHLAESISGASDKLTELLSKNHINGMQALWGMWGTVSTAGVEGTAKAFNNKISTDATNYADDPSAKNHSAMIGDVAAALREATASLKKETDKRDAPASMAEKLAGAAAGVSGPLSLRPDNSSVINDLTGEVNYYKGLLRTDKSTTTNQALAKQQGADQDKKDAADLAKKEMEAAKAAATARVAAMQSGLDAMKLQYNMSIKATYDFWEVKKSTERAGSIAYNDIVKKQSELAVQAATQAHAKIQKAIADAKRSGGQDATAGPDIINSSARFFQQHAAKTSMDNDADARDSNQLDMNRASTTAHLKEAQITDAAGDSMTRYAAAVAIANVHAKELSRTLFDLKANIDIAQSAYDNATDPDAKRQAGHALTQAKDAYSNAQASGAIQTIHDKQATDDGFTSATTGAKDALNDFVKASRDSAGMMRELVNNTLSGLNSQIVNGMMGGKTNFGQFGIGVAQSIAGATLQKGEGAVMGLLHLGGKLGTKGNPIYTKSADIVAGSAASGLMSKTGGMPSIVGKMGGFGGFLGKAVGAISSFLPFLASGGPIDGPAIVGEQGPELFIPSSSGHIVPNHQLTASSRSNGGNQNVYYSVDARGTDPVQTEQRVRSAIMASQKQSVVQSVKQVHQQAARKPVRR